MMETKGFSNISSFLNQKVAIYPLVTFRVLFGALMLFSTIRFWYNGWIEDFYIAPEYFFSYFGQDWILPYSTELIYGLFIIMAICALFIAIGLFYRVSSLLFFIAFTYVELIDKTTYLNHYYFISIIAFLLVLIPAHRAYSLDAKLFSGVSSNKAPRWSILALKCQITIVYLFAGIAKLDYDWLFKAQPMALWLKSKADLPVIGEWLTMEPTAFVFSWLGMLFDLCIVFLLTSKKLRPVGYLAVLAFHGLTWWLFPIGVFPWVMIGFTLIFFSANWHKNIWNTFYKLPSTAVYTKHMLIPSGVKSSMILGVLLIHFVIQLFLPVRYALQEGNLFWTESGYRFSWRVMLMEKTGNLEFKVVDKVSGNERLVFPDEYFTAFQQRQLVTQPDMILQAANMIAEDYQNQGTQVEVYANSHASLNGEKHRVFINPSVDLAAVKNSAKRSWVLPYEK